MSDLSNTLFIGKVLLHFPSLGSTNAYMSELLTQMPVSEGTVVSTFHQFAGRGQVGNTWQCAPDENIAMSILLHPKFLSPQRQFLLNCIAALAVRDTLARHTDQQVSVKWPNDVLIADKKVCGILIQNTLSSTQILTSIVGIGININQQKFSETLPFATSLRIATGKQYDLKALQLECFATLERYYLSLRAGNRHRVERAYLAQLYAYQEVRTYQLPDGTYFRASIVGISPIGQLILAWEGREQHFNVKEVMLVQQPKA